MTPIIKSIGNKKLAIPTAILAASGFGQNQEVGVYPLRDVAVILKREMTAMELVNALDGLQSMVVDLTCHLAAMCGPCEDCTGSGECPAVPERSAVKLPEEVRREAGIAEDAKLCAWPGKVKGTVTVAQADCRYDLTDMPDWVMEILPHTGACMGTLAELLMSEDIVYGG